MVQKQKMTGKNLLEVNLYNLLKGLTEIQTASQYLECLNCLLDKTFECINSVQLTACLLDILKWRHTFALRELSN